MKRTAKPATIAAAVTRLLDDPSYRERAHVLGEAVRRDVDRNLVHELESLVGAGPER